MATVTVKADSITSRIFVCLEEIFENNTELDAWDYFLNDHLTLILDMIADQGGKQSVIEALEKHIGSRKPNYANA